jgi:hypothetical protein
VTVPKAFISYAWTSPERQQWVIDLATQLVENGVDVNFDKWNLREGHDAIKFMEAMVTDPSITKVIVICDKNYAEKADNRKGGVGTESQIMSPEIYKKADQTKFVAVVPEVDANGEPYLPKFFVSRIYIDMTISRYATNFEQLLRWLYDKPLIVKPPLGRMPEFLNENIAASPTRAEARRTIEIIKTSSGSPTASAETYLNKLAGVLEGFRVDRDKPDFPQAVLDNIDAFLPFRNEFIEFLMAAAPDSNTALAKTLQRFFERIIPLMSRPESISNWRDWDYDNYLFLVHELFLYVVAIFLKYERFDTLAELLDLRFYVRDETNSTEFMQTFSIIRKPMKALGPKQQELRRVSLRADLLEQRSHVSGLKFADLMAADFVLFLRSAKIETDYRAWYPETLSYSRRNRGPFEVFARAESTAYFQRLSLVLGFSTKEELQQLISMYSTDGRAGRWLPHWNYEVLDIAGLSNLAKLGSRP